MSSRFSTLSYSACTKNLYYSIVLVFPMLFLYEILCFIFNYNFSFEIRNGADVIIREYFGYFGQYAQALYVITLLLVFLVIAYKNKDIIQEETIQISFLFLMILESFAWSVSMYFLFNFLSNNLLSSTVGTTVFEQFYLSIGAGIWEEILFRLILLGLCIVVLNKILKYNYYYSSILSVLISSLLFSLFHYVGFYGDTFTYSSFIYRSLAGGFLGTLYIIRGFGITVYTHIFYDIILISIPLI